MPAYAEQLTELAFGQYIAPGIDAFFIQSIQIDQMISHLIRRIAEHQHDFFYARGDSL